MYEISPPAQFRGAGGARRRDGRSC